MYDIVGIKNQNFSLIWNMKTYISEKNALTKPLTKKPNIDFYFYDLTFL